jgi:uncharacterized protein (DUF433 family)
MSEGGPVIMRDEEILGGIPVFAGTRVPVQTMIDYLEQGQPLEAFLDDFPTVNSDQAHQVFALLRQKLMELAA